MTSVVFIEKPVTAVCREKNTRQTQIEGRSKKSLKSTPPNCHGHEKQGKTEKLSKTKEPKETG